MVIVFSVLTLKFHCGKDVVNVPYEYEFTGAVDIYPLKKSYSLNDTIWIETDLPSKFLYDGKSGLTINADTTKILFRATYNEFGTSITNPPSGFCEVISSNGNIVQQRLSQWATGGDIQYGCGKPDFKCRIGFKPNYRGTYSLVLQKEDLLGNCPGKIKPIYATVSLRYKNVDLNRDIFDGLPNSEKGGDLGTFYINKINNREAFIIKVE